jgi:hypothetical protein
MRILMFVVLVLCLIALSIYRSHEEGEQRKLQQLRTSYDQLNDRSVHLQRAIKAINEIETVKKNSEVRSALEAALQQADTQKSRIQSEIANLPKPSLPISVGVAVVGNKAAGGDSPQVKQLKDQLALSESHEQSIRDKIATMPATSPDSTAIKNLVLQSTVGTPAQNAPSSSSVGTTNRVFWVQVGITLVFGLTAAWTIVRERGKANAKNKEWAFATVGTIVGFWLKG